MSGCFLWRTQVKWISMHDAECIAFLQWCLPRMRMRWRGFCKVRSQVCKRVGRRLEELGIKGLDTYRSYLEENPEEWERLGFMCRVTISRFCRDRAVFDALQRHVLPELSASARKDGRELLRCWCVGCASGEEAYSLKIIARQSSSVEAPPILLEITATDIDPEMLDRARRGVYSRGSLKDLPGGWMEEAFEREGALYRVRTLFRDRIVWMRQDIRHETPEGAFDLVLCRNLVFTYFDKPLQTEVLARVGKVLRSNGALVLGIHESLPEGSCEFSPWLASLRTYRREP